MTLLSIIAGGLLLIAFGLDANVIGIACAIVLLVYGIWGFRDVSRRWDEAEARNRQQFISDYAAACRRQREAREASERA